MKSLQTYPAPFVVSNLLHKLDCFFRRRIKPANPTLDKYGSESLINLAEIVPDEMAMLKL